MRQQEHALVGRRVLNKWRQSCDLSKAYQDDYRGTVVAVSQGCNPVIWVLFDGRSYWSAQAPQDLAFCELWPREGSEVIFNLENLK